MINIANDTVTTEQFLEDIHGYNAQIYFNVNRVTWKNKPQTYNEAKQKLQYLNDQGKDICFIVNSGGTQNADITKINACFGDWDCGKTKDGFYLPLNQVQQKKENFRTILDSFPLKPSYLIDTRNGYHFYWIMNNCTIDQYSTLQSLIISSFNSDPSVNKLAQVMRLPGYKWRKKQESYDSYDVRIIECNHIRYSFDDLYKSFSSFLSSSSSSSDHNQILHQCPLQLEYYQEEKKGNKYHNNTGIYNTSTIVVPITQTKFNNEKRYYNLKDIEEDLKKRDLAEYLNIKNTTNQESISITCPFHTDKSNSASIYKYQSKYYLKCHSSNCDFDKGTIIEVEQHLKKCTREEAIQNLCRYYQIKYDEIWKEEYKKILEDNIEKIENISKEEYPSLYYYINRIKMDIVDKIQYAQKNIKYRSKNGDPIFYGSIREFSRRKNGIYINSPNNHNRRIDRYCLLNMMKKVPDELIPEYLLKDSLYVKNQKKMKYRIQYYTIPEYTESLFTEAEETAKILRDNMVKVKSISRELIYRLFSPVKVKEIYPQIDTCPLTEQSKAFKKQVEIILDELIEQKGYATGHDILMKLWENNSWTNVAKSRLGRCLPSILIEKGIYERKANKTLKEKYQIESKGYPNIIIPND